MPDETREKPPLSFRGFLQSRKGQGLVEYGLILMLVVIVIMAAMAIGESIPGPIENATEALGNAP